MFGVALAAAQTEAGEAERRVTEVVVRRRQIHHLRVVDDRPQLLVFVTHTLPTKLTQLLSTFTGRRDQTQHVECRPAENGTVI